MYINDIFIHIFISADPLGGLGILDRIVPFLQIRKRVRISLFWGTPASSYQQFSPPPLWSGAPSRPAHM